MSDNKKELNISINDEMEIIKYHLNEARKNAEWAKQSNEEGLPINTWLCFGFAITELELIIRRLERIVQNVR